jgi:uracil-DNA glycosylase
MSQPSGMPGRDCPRCPRLVAFRQSWRQREQGWFNAPVASFGPPTARLLIVGLAPGLRGANRTGRPFTGDYAGDLLFAALNALGFASGHYQARPDDDLTLIDCRITNAVRCVPPQNKPTPAEIANCRPFLSATVEQMPHLAAVLALGRIAHETVVVACGARRSDYPFAHGRMHAIGTLKLFDSYHCSRLNTNTGVLTPKMFHKLLARIRAELDAAPAADSASQAAALQ